MSILLRLLVVSIVSATIAACSGDITGPGQNSPPSPLLDEIPIPFEVGQSYIIYTPATVLEVVARPPWVVTATHAGTTVTFTCHEQGGGWLVILLESGQPGVLQGMYFDVVCVNPVQVA